MFYTVIENQKNADGTFGLLATHFGDMNDALARFFTICASASISNLPYHACIMLSSDGHIIRQEIFDRQEQPTPEPEE